ncbi:hypothetical protein [Duncaniella freteri]|uniref:hypothetical protein n=1 Tax=Duncaniella freteri TaxID=2530391 RepID=UPI003F67CAB4
MKVNIGMAQDCFGPSDDMAVAIDPSFISKSGSLTYGIGRFWSGVAQRVKRGLEIMAIGAISLSKHTCVMLGAVHHRTSGLLNLRNKCQCLTGMWHLSGQRRQSCSH